MTLSHRTKECYISSGVPYWNKRKTFMGKSENPVQILAKEGLFRSRQRRAFLFLWTHFCFSPWLYSVCSLSCAKSPCQNSPQEEHWCLQKYSLWEETLTQRIPNNSILRKESACSTQNVHTWEEEKPPENWGEEVPWKRKTEGYSLNQWRKPRCWYSLDWAQVYPYQPSQLTPGLYCSIVPHFLPRYGKSWSLQNSGEDKTHSFLLHSPSHGLVWIYVSPVQSGFCPW